MAQAREAEPNAWSFLRQRGYKFSKGDKIIIDNEGIENRDKVHKLSAFEKWASNKLSIELAILTFIIGFIILFVLSGYYFFLSIRK